MSTLGLFIAFFGVLVIVSRSPLIFAPERTRSVFMKIMATPSRMRVLGLLMALLGALAAWVGTTEAGPLADFVNTVGIIIIFFGAGIVIPFASPVGKMFREIIGAVSTSFLRGAGVLAVILGAWVVWYGMGL